MMTTASEFTTVLVTAGAMEVRVRWQGVTSYEDKKYLRKQRDGLHWAYQNKPHLFS